MEVIMDHCQRPATASCCGEHPPRGMSGIHALCATTIHRRHRGYPARAPRISTHNRIARTLDARVPPTA